VAAMALAIVPTELCSHVAAAKVLVDDRRGQRAARVCVRGSAGFDTMARVPAQVSDIQLLLRARHALIVLDTEEEERAQKLLDAACSRLALLRFVWTAAAGLRRLGETTPVYGTGKLDACLEHIASSGADNALYHLSGVTELFGDPERAARLNALLAPLAAVESALVISGPASALPETIRKNAAVISIKRPSDGAYYALVNQVLAELRKRMPISMELSAEESGTLINHLRGLTLSEARQIMTQAMLRDGKLWQDDLAFVLKQKRAIVEQSGVLEYFASESGLDDIAGLGRLKHWLTLRAPVFQDPARAAEFGLSAPRGLLLLGVQGCGKSLCAKAVAQTWNLPLVRLDPARVFDKNLGESEKNFKRAIALCERLSPITLWIDEIEKMFASGQGEDSGAGQRLLGTFLTWLQEKQESVFVIGTSNDITRLPPELLRKGRFDEIFFVDLPDEATRAEILRLHLGKRKRDPTAFELAALAKESAGFSGAELEQAVVSALYRAYAEKSELTQAHLLDELGRTKPLSTTMAEPIAALRAWAQGRTTGAD
jgi:AAA+ superfamily predicted ATPase